jgi:hypothetical protein
MAFANPNLGVTSPTADYQSVACFFATIAADLCREKKKMDNNDMTAVSSFTLKYKTLTGQIPSVGRTQPIETVVATLRRLLAGSMNMNVFHRADLDKMVATAMNHTPSRPYRRKLSIPPIDTPVLMVNYQYVGVNRIPYGQYYIESQVFAAPNTQIATINVTWPADLMCTNGNVNGVAHVNHVDVGNVNIQTINPIQANGTVWIIANQYIELATTIDEENVRAGLEYCDRNNILPYQHARLPIPELIYRRLLTLVPTVFSVQDKTDIIEFELHILTAIGALYRAGVTN